MISLLFLIYENSNIDELIKILNTKNVEATFFIDGLWLEKNNEKITNIAKNHEIGNLSYSGDYTNSSFSWMDIVIKNVINQGYSYCLMFDKNDEYMDICKINGNKTIYPNLYIKNNGLVNLKQNIKAGSLIAVEVNNNILNELDNMINYIESKGYQIAALNNHLME